MPFNVNQFIRRVNATAFSKQIIEQPKIVEVKPVIIEEPKQEIEIPVYEPESDEEPEHHVGLYVKKVPNSKITRRVNLNPLSDS